LILENSDPFNWNEIGALPAFDSYSKSWGDAQPTLSGFSFRILILEDIEVVDITSSEPNHLKYSPLDFSKRKRKFLWAPKFSDCS
jgi:hypothetical protein